MPRPSKFASMPIAKIFELRDEIADHLIQRRKALEAEMAQLDKHAAGARRAAGVRRATTASRPSPMLGKKAAIKFKDPKTGNAWSGRGVYPKWLVPLLKAGHKLEEFRIGGAKPAVAAARKTVAKKVARKPARKARKKAKTKGAYS